MEGYIGEIRFFAGNFAPRNWAFCQGQLLAINSNTALFAIIGTIYGGDGRTTMALPDLRGRVPVQQGNGPGLPNVDLGERFGSHQVTLNALNLPSHNHGFSVTASSANGDTQVPTGAVLGDAGLFDNEFVGAPAAGDAVEMAGDTTDNAGASQPFDNHPPSLGLNAIICLYGIFPSRS